ncbi:hypothetical protein Tco_1280226, partial [Tanacetum coccineum]
SCSDVVAFACVILSLLLEVALCKCSSTGRPLGAYNLGVATPRALVHAGDKTSGDARSWYMISGDAKSWASKKQTCITASTMESEFVALSIAGKEAESLR